MDKERAGRIIEWFKDNELFPKVISLQEVKETRKDLMDALKMIYKIFSWIVSSHVRSRREAILGYIAVLWNALQLTKIGEEDGLVVLLILKVLLLKVSLSMPLVKQANVIFFNRISDMASRYHIFWEQ